jgi:sugar phosphate permease
MNQTTPIDPFALRRKVAWRVLPLVILLYSISYLDRANVAFAKLRMGEALGFSQDVFGFGIGVFFTAEIGVGTAH